MEGNKLGVIGIIDVNSMRVLKINSFTHLYSSDTIVNSIVDRINNMIAI